MFVKNSFEYDARVTREATALIEAGHGVTVVALRPSGPDPGPHMTPYGARVIRVPRVEFGLGRFTRRLARAAESAARNEAAVRGKDVDPALIAELRRLETPSTAVPTARADEVSHVVAPRRGKLRTVLTARLTRAAATSLRHLITTARRFLAGPIRVIKNVVLNRRMRHVGIAEAADVYHAHDLNTLWVGRSCARTTEARLVYDSHELATERSRMGRVWRWWATRTERRWLPAADALIVASPVWIRILEQKHGSIPGRSVAVLNTPESQEVVALDVREPAGLPAGVPVVLYQGSIQEHRGIEPAIDAMAGIDGVAFVVVGYGHHRPVLERLVSNRGLDDRVRFIGPYPPDLLLRYTASADVGLCTIVSSSLSYHTSLPNKLFEYLMAGVPILGSEALEIARVVTESGAGVVVPATDPDAIAAGIRRLLADPERFRAAARQASSMFNWGVESAKLVDLYRELEAA